MQFKEDSKNRAAYLKIEKLTHETFRAIRQAYYRIGKNLSRHLNEKMLEKPKHGRTYYFKKAKISKYGPAFTRKKHIASAPHEYPANMTGAMRKSRAFIVSGHTQLEFGLKVPYAKYIEDGTPGGQLVARKPLRRSFEDTKGNARTYFEEEIKKALSK
jgi:hypothetical protein